MNASRTVEALLARIAAHATNAPLAVVTSVSGEKSSVIATSASQRHYPDDIWTFRAGQGADCILYVSDLARSTEFHSHPLPARLAFARRLLHIPISNSDGSVTGGLTIVNPKRAWPFSEGIIRVLDEIVDGLALACAPPSNSAPKGLHEAGPHRSPFTEAHTDLELLPHELFLLDTLGRGASLISRGNVSYTALRHWKGRTKAAQVKAMAVAKREPTDAFLVAIASEIADHVKRASGAASFQCVVPVPGGHSRSSRAFSVRLAEAVSKQLDLPLIEVFRSHKRSGTSHPRNNVSLPPYVARTKIKYRSVLLIDDIATTGTHVEACVSELRKMVDAVQTVVWIGPT